MTFLMSLARAAKRRVPMVSSTLNAAGLKKGIMRFKKIMRWKEIMLCIRKGHAFKRQRAVEGFTCSTRS